MLVASCTEIFNFAMSERLVHGFPGILQNGEHTSTHVFTEIRRKTYTFFKFGNGDSIYVYLLFYAMKY